MSKILLSFLCVLSFFVGFGQTGTIKGYVKEKSDSSATPFVEVWLMETKIATWTDSTGYFKIDSVPVGNYNIRFHLSGRTDTIIQQLKVVSNETLLIFTSLGFCKYDQSINNKTCPVCGKSNRVVPIIYGFPTKRALLDEKRGKYLIGGSGITGCDPNWYCKRDKMKF